MKLAGVWWSLSPLRQEEILGNEKEQRINKI
jgi:hypothetical protein